MRFLRVEIRNFRNIEALDLDMTDPDTGEPLPVAVLVGPNGSGKTTVLDAMQRLAFPFAFSAANTGMRPAERELRVGADEAKLVCKCVLAEHERLFVNAKSNGRSGNGSLE